MPKRNDRNRKSMGPVPTEGPESKILGPYHLGECIGRGGFGQVYRGLNIETGVTVAVKQVSVLNVAKSELEGIETEINLLKKLKHPNIVKYIDTIRADTALNIVIEFVENGSLSSMLKKFGGALPETLVALYIQQVLAGLSYLHVQGVIHRDIKCANLLSTKDGLIKLADFGVATKINESSKGDSVVGSPFWMAPEVIEMSGSQSTACDIWSVGCSVVEMLTGSPPYFNLQPMPALFRIVQDEHPPLPAGISPVLEDFLLSCFQKDPNLRSSADDLLKHPWLRNPSKGVSEIMEKVEDTEVLEAVENTFKMRGDNLKEEMERERQAYEAEQIRKETASESEEEDWDAELEMEEVVDATETIRLSKEQLNGKKEEKEEEEEEEEDPFADMEESDEEEQEPSRVRGSSPTRGLNRFVEQDDDDEFFDFEDHEETLDVLKVEQQKHRVWDISDKDDTPNRSDSVFIDPFADQGFDEIDMVGDQDAKVAEEVQQLIGALNQSLSSPTLGASEKEKVLEATQRLGDVFNENTNQIKTLLQRQGVIPLLEMLDTSHPDPSLLLPILRMFQQALKLSEQLGQSLCLVGLIPIVVRMLDNPLYEIRLEASRLIRSFCSTPERKSPSFTRQIFIACGGLSSLVKLLSSASTKYEENYEIVFIGLDSIRMVFDTPTNPKNDFCRLFCKAGLLPHIVATLGEMLRSGATLSMTDQYISKILHILLVFAERGDVQVKKYLSESRVLIGLLDYLDFLSHDHAVMLLKSLKAMSMDVNARDALEEFGAIPTLVRLLDSPYPMYSNQILPALYYLFRIKASRQEKMALAGIIPLLQRNIVTDHTLKQFALPMITKLAHTSSRVRQELKKHGGVVFYLDLLRTPYWQMQAMDSLAVWLSDDTRRVETILTHNPNVHKLIQVFRDTERNVFGSILRSLAKMISLSDRVNRALGASSVFLECVVKRLDEGEAIVRKPLLAMLRELLSEAKDSKTMGSKQGLDDVLNRLANDETSVIVQDLAQNILKDFK